MFQMAEVLNEYFSSVFATEDISFPVPVTKFEGDKSDHLGQLFVTSGKKIKKIKTKWVDDGSPVDVAYLDFNKAFDKVPHQRLAHGIGNDVTNWMLDRKVAYTQKTENNSRW